MKTESFEMFLQMEHVHPDLSDVPVEVVVRTYKGSNESDDPSEIEILSIRSTGQYEFKDGLSLVIIPAGYLYRDFDGDKKIEDQIYNKYNSL